MSDHDQQVAAEAFPDVFSDAVSVAVNPFALALTFLLSDPSRQGDPTAARIVTRVRLPPELARALGEALAQTSKPTKGSKS